MTNHLISCPRHLEAKRAKCGTIRSCQNEHINPRKRNAVGLTASLSVCLAATAAKRSKIAAPRVAPDSLSKWLNYSLLIRFCLVEKKICANVGGTVPFLFGLMLLQLSG